MRGLVSCMLVVACGGTPPPSREPHKSTFELVEETRDVAVAELIHLVESKNAPALAAMLEEPLAYGGLWFPDTDCRRQFATTGRIHGEALRVFARCLIDLELARTDRVHSFPDVAVLSYAPGIELDVFFVRSAAGDVVIRFIGYAARRSARDALPTVTQAALEANRIDPQPTVLDDATRAAVDAEVATHAWEADYQGARVFTWFKLCLDATGAITSAKPRLTTSIVAQEAFAKVVGAWTFRPFMLGAQPSPVCALIRLGDRPAAEDRLRLPPMVPPEYDDETMFSSVALGKRLEGHMLISPSKKDKDRLAANGISRLDGTVVFCITETGTTDRVKVLRSTGLASYDALLVEGVSGWRYPPVTRDGQAIRACGTVAFVYSQFAKR